MVLDQIGIGSLLALGVGMIVFAFIVMIALYVYFALALQSIARKLKYKNPWLAWIPFLNIAMIFQLGNFHWAWVFLYLATAIPLVGFLAVLALLVLTIISFWRMFEKLNYSGALSLLLLVPVARLIMIGVVAWNKK